MVTEDKKKRPGLGPSHAHQATGNMGGRGKCSRYLYYRPYPLKSLIQIKKKLKILKKSETNSEFKGLV